MNEPRDTTVGDALRGLDVPDHAPDFWSRLDARLGQDPVAGDPADPADGDDEHETVIDLQRSPAARRAAVRRRTPLFALAAVVAVVVALVVGLAVLGPADDDESVVDSATVPDGDAAPDAGDPVAPDPDAAVPGPSVSDTTMPPTTTSVVADQPAAVRAEETAVAWLEALAAGDTEQAYGALEDRTRAELDRPTFEELSSGLAEGAAAFAVDGITRDVAAVPAASGLFHVVTFTGDVQREGMVETASYPVVVTGTGVHLTLDGPQVELDPEYASSSGTTLAAPLELLVSDTADTWMWVDGAAPERFLAGGRLQVGEDALGGGGTHVVSVAAIEGGRITARSFTVVVP